MSLVVGDEMVSTAALFQRRHHSKKQHGKVTGIISNIHTGFIFSRYILFLSHFFQDSQNFMYLIFNDFWTIFLMEYNFMSYK